MSMEIDFLRRSARCSRLEKIRNNVIREKMNNKNSVVDYIRYKQLNWYGDVQRMDEERLPRKILEWCPPGKRRGRPRNSWMQEVTRGMRERGIDLEWVDREGLRREIKLQVQKTVKTSRICIKKLKYYFTVCQIQVVLTDMPCSTYYFWKKLILFTDWQLWAVEKPIPSLSSPI